MINMRQMQAHQLSASALRSLSVEMDTPTAANDAGTLYVHDMFIAQEPEQFNHPTLNPHGIHVSRAVRQQGFQGRILGRDVVEMHSGLGPNTRTLLNHQNQLATPGRTPQQVITDIQGYAGYSAADILEQKSDYLDNLSTRGASSSVANFSQGLSKAGLTRNLAMEVLPALSGSPDLSPEVRQRGQTVLANMAKAFGLDEQRLVSPDPAVHQPERAKLVQNLVGHVNQGVDSNPAAIAARSRYDSSVAKFEGNKNSLVISAGNDGNIAQDLQGFSGGTPLHFPVDFSRNVLENEAVTSVGAIESGPNGVQRASYTSRSNGIDLYAQGAVETQGASVQGTSFAAPRVAGTLAEIHRRNPNFSSAQAETMLRQQMTFSQSFDGQSSAVLSTTL